MRSTSIGSHYDSRENPGADDNATGVGCQLEMARIFAKQYFAKTIVFAIFDSEERWEAVTGKHRLGSLRYVDQHRTDNIKGMISVDMIGWQAPTPNTITAPASAAGQPSAPSATTCKRPSQTYGSGLIGVISSFGEHERPLLVRAGGHQRLLFD